MILKNVFRTNSWVMETGGSIPHSQGLLNNPYPDPNEPNSKD